MDFMEDMGGCALIAIVGVVVLLLVACVAVVILGASLPNIFG